MYFTVRTGEIAREGGLVRCVRCHQAMRVEKDQAIPACNQCGNDLFEASSGPGLPI